MKIISLIAFTLLYQNLFSQKTIIDQDFPVAGDTMHIATSADLFIDINSTGPNSVWDFSDLIDNDTTQEVTYSIEEGGFILNFQFGFAAPQKYKATYYQKYDGLPVEQITNFLPITLDAINRIVKVEEDKVNYVGYAIEIEGQTIGFRSDTIETAYKLPLEYGDSYESRGYTELDFNPFYDGKFLQYRQRTSVVDGYGTLTTPYGTYSDVIRIHHRISEQDSIMVNLNPDDETSEPQWFPIRRTLSNFEWWDNQRNRPVLRVETNEFFGAKVPTKVIYLYEPKVTLENLGNVIFPNPTSHFVTVHTEKEMREVKVYNLDGQLIHQGKAVADSNEYNIDVSSWASGRYSVQVLTTGVDQIFSLIVL